jgi:hypothetical protein
MGVLRPNAVPTETELPAVAPAADRLRAPPALKAGIVGLGARIDRTPVLLLAVGDSSREASSARFLAFLGADLTQIPDRASASTDVPAHRAEVCRGGARAKLVAASPFGGRGPKTKAAVPTSETAGDRGIAASIEKSLAVPVGTTDDRWIPCRSMLEHYRTTMLVQDGLGCPARRRGARGRRRGSAPIWRRIGRRWRTWRPHDDRTARQRGRDRSRNSPRDLLHHAECNAAQLRPLWRGEHRARAPRRSGNPRS